MTKAQDLEEGGKLARDIQPVTYSGGKQASNGHASFLQL